MQLGRRWLPIGSLRVASIRPPFIQIDKLKHRLHCARWQADLGETLVQSLRAGIAPAALGHERVPYFNLLIVRLAAVLECPFKQRCIALVALESLYFKRRVINFEELTASPVETTL